MQLLHVETQGYYIHFIIGNIVLKSSDLMSSLCVLSIHSVEERENNKSLI